MNALNRYLIFLLEEWRILAFGVLFLFFSCFGRTFYIALFGGEIRAAFDLTPGEFSYIYSAATLSGVLFIPWLGKLIDDVNLTIYATSMVVVLAAASFLLSTTPNVIVLFIALFGFRVTGGSMMTHTVIVTMARHFVLRRGMATATSSIGVPLAESVLPIVAVFAMGAVGWRTVWTVSSLCLALICIPMIVWLLKPSPKMSVPRNVQENTAAPDPSRSATRRDVMRDPYFYALSPALILPTPMITGLFFHHATIAESKAWSLDWLATCFIAYAVATVATSFIVGPLVDRYGARAVLPWTVGPMIFGLGFLAFGASPFSALPYMLCIGMTTGARSTLTAVIWAEIYGTRHLGSIRSVVHTITMLLAGLSPAVLGWLIDHGVSLKTMVEVFVVLLLSCGFFARLAVSKRV
jgi:MFS family permease